jgi:hypothetical protein
VSRRPRRAGVALIMTAVALASCGDGGGGGGGGAAAGEQTQLRADVTEALTTKDPIACTRYATQRFVEELTGLRGPAAVRECREAADDKQAESVSFDRVAISGRRASATVRPRGGDDGLETLEFKLRKSGEHWKLDRISGGTLERAEFLRLTREELRAPPDALSPKAADCVIRDLERRKDDAVVRQVLSGDPSLLMVPVTTCLVLNDISDRPEHRGFVRCIERRMRRELTEGATGRRIAGEGGVQALQTKTFGRVANRIVAGCAREHGLATP